MRVARLSHDLIALRSPLSIDRLKLGQLLRVGDAGHQASVLCSRGGTMLASLLPSDGKLTDGAEASMLNGQLLHAPLGGDGAHLGARIIDCFGNVLDGGDSTMAPAAPLFSTAPAQAQLLPINRSLHTGTPAVDALTPIGRGQSMMLFGERGLGKTCLLYTSPSPRD